MRHKKALIALILTVVLFSSSVVYAQGTWHIVPFDMTINPNTSEPAFTMYVDPEATLPLTGVHFGQVESGQHLDFEIYVKNTGEATGMAGVRVPVDTSTWLDWTVTPSPQSINPGDVVMFLWEADVIAVVESPTFTSASFECYEP